MTALEKTTRTTLGLPVERFAQLRALADARDLAPAALVEEWITKAVAEGAPGAITLPGYGAWRDDNVIVVEIAGRALPMLPIEQALKLSFYLDAVAPIGGDPERRVNMRGEVTAQIGTVVPFEIGSTVLAMQRKGRGVVFGMKNRESGDFDAFAAPTKYVSELAEAIRVAVDNP